MKHSAPGSGPGAGGNGSTRLFANPRLPFVIVNGECEKRAVSALKSFFNKHGIDPKEVKCTRRPDVPSAALCSTPLFNALVAGPGSSALSLYALRAIHEGATVLLRVGTCGAVTPDLPVGSVVIPPMAFDFTGTGAAMCEFRRTLIPTSPSTVNFYRVPFTQGLVSALVAASTAVLSTQALSATVISVNDLNVGTGVNVQGVVEPNMQITTPYFETLRALLSSNALGEGPFVSDMESAALATIIARLTGMDIPVVAAAILKVTNLSFDHSIRESDISEPIQIVAKMLLDAKSGRESHDTSCLCQTA